MSNQGVPHSNSWLEISSSKIVKKTTNLELKVEQMQLEGMLEETITFPLILHMVLSKFQLIHHHQSELKQSHVT